MNPVEISECDQRFGLRSVATRKSTAKTERSQRLCCLCFLLFEKPSALIAAATGPNAEQILANIKYQLERKRGSGRRLPRKLRPDPGTLDADSKLTVAIDVT